MIDWLSRIQQLYLCRGVRYFTTSILDMTIKNLMMRLQQR